MISSGFNVLGKAVVSNRDCLSLLCVIPNEVIQLVVTSPPYNLDKSYEETSSLMEYVAKQESVIRECVRVLSPTGSICWQVGNYVDKLRGKKAAIIPIDIILYPVFAGCGLQLRNRIVWHFEHGLHCKNRFSGRYETILWFTKSDDYVFNLDPVRVPQKYPNKKHFKGSKVGEYSCNPLGKNPGDVWIIPNVKNNHVEKTDHPCQFPVALVERLVLSLTNKNDWVLDPFLGSGTSIVAAVKHGRRGIGSDTVREYTDISKKRICDMLAGRLKTRPLNKPVFVNEAQGI